MNTNLPTVDMGHCKGTTILINNNFLGRIDVRAYRVMDDTELGHTLKLLIA